MKFQVVPRIGNNKGKVVAEFTTLAYAIRFGDECFPPGRQSYSVLTKTEPSTETEPLDMPAQVQEFMDFSGQHTRMDRSPKIIWDGPVTRRRKWLREEHNELQDAIDDRDPVGIIDGGCDLVYVIFGMFAEFGLDPRPFFSEVHRSNMTKIPNDKEYRGKIRKGADFQRPNLSRTFIDLYGVDKFDRFMG